MAGASLWTERHKSLGERRRKRERERFIQHGLWIKIKRFSGGAFLVHLVGRERRREGRKEKKKKRKET